MAELGSWADPRARTGKTGGWPLTEGSWAGKLKSGELSPPMTAASDQFARVGLAARNAGKLTLDDAALCVVR